MIRSHVLYVQFRVLKTRMLSWKHSFLHNYIVNKKLFETFSVMLLILKEENTIGSF